MTDDFISWMTESKPQGDGYLIPDQLLKEISEHPDLLEGIAQSDIELVFRFDGQNYKFYRVGYIFEIMGETKP